MKIAFVTNYYNHHQKPFADALYSMLGEDYHFIETEKITKERLDMGWGGDERPSYILQNYLDDESRNRCQRIIDEADVVIIGSASRNLIKQRLKKGKLTFYYSERPYKIMPPVYKLAVHFLRNLKNIIRY